MIRRLLASALVATALTYRKDSARRQSTTIIVDQQLYDVTNLSRETDALIKADKLEQAKNLIERQLSIDAEHPCPYAQRAQYYFGVAGKQEMTGARSLELLDQALEDLDQALKLAKIHTPYKVDSDFSDKVRLHIGLVRGMQATCKANMGDVSGAIRDVKASLEVKLSTDARRAAKNLLVTLEELERQVPQTELTSEDKGIGAQKQTRSAQQRTSARAPQKADVNVNAKRRKPQLKKREPTATANMSPIEGQPLLEESETEEREEECNVNATMTLYERAKANAKTKWYSCI